MLAAQPGPGRGQRARGGRARRRSALRRLLAADPALANVEGGPFGWPPLLYLAYARHDPDVSAEAVRDAVAALLEAGADPDAGYLWHGDRAAVHRADRSVRRGRGRPGQPAGATRSGRRWPGRCSRPGADPNDAPDALQPDVPARRQPPRAPLRVRPRRRARSSPSSWAGRCVHGMDARVELLVRHGVDPDTEVGGRYDVARRSAYAAALTTGHPGPPSCCSGSAPRPSCRRRRRVVAAVLHGRRRRAGRCRPRSRRAPGWWRGRPTSATATPYAARSSSAGTSTGGPAPTCRRTRSGRPGCTPPPATATSAMVRLLLELGADPDADGPPLRGHAARSGPSTSATTDLAELLSDRSG